MGWLRKLTRGIQGKPAGNESAATVDARRQRQVAEFGGLDEFGFPLSGKNPPAEISDQVQLASERAVTQRNARLDSDALGALQGGLGQLQSYRPGGAAAMASPFYGQMANVLQNSKTEAPDLLHDYRRQQGAAATKAGKRAQNMQIAGAVVGAIATVATGGAAAPLVPALMGLATMAGGAAGGAGGAMAGGGGAGAAMGAGAAQGALQGAQNPSGQTGAPPAGQGGPGAPAGGGQPNVGTGPFSGVPASAFQAEQGGGANPQQGPGGGGQKPQGGGGAQGGAPPAGGPPGSSGEGGPGAPPGGGGAMDPGASALGPATAMGTPYPSREGISTGAMASLGPAFGPIMGRIYVEEFGNDDWWGGQVASIDRLAQQVDAMMGA